MDTRDLVVRWSRRLASRAKRESQKQNRLGRRGVCFGAGGGGQVLVSRCLLELLHSTKHQPAPSPANERARAHA